jgi:hypothetical protein
MPGYGFSKMPGSGPEFSESGSKILIAALACAKACASGAKLFESNFFKKDSAEVKKFKFYLKCSVLNLHIRSAVKF